jgi:hypothetical protein
LKAYFFKSLFYFFFERAARIPAKALIFIGIETWFPGERKVFMADRSAPALCSASGEKPKIPSRISE